MSSGRDVTSFPHHHPLPLHPGGSAGVIHAGLYPPRLQPVITTAWIGGSRRCWCLNKLNQLGEIKNTAVPFSLSKEKTHIHSKRVPHNLLLNLYVFMNIKMIKYIYEQPPTHSLQQCIKLLTTFACLDPLTEIKDLHLWEDVGLHEQQEKHGVG